MAFSRTADGCLIRFELSLVLNFNTLFDFRNKFIKSETEIRASQTLKGNALTEKASAQKKNTFFIIDSENRDSN